MKNTNTFNFDYMFIFLLFGVIPFVPVILKNLCVFFLLAISVYRLMRRNLKIKYKGLIVCICLTILAYLLYCLYYMRGFNRVIQIVSCFGVLFYGSKIDFSNIHTVKLTKLLIMIGVLINIFYFPLSKNYFPYSSFYYNSNVFGNVMIIYIWSIFCFFNRCDLKYYLFLLCSIFLLLLTNNRIGIITIILFFIFYRMFISRGLANAKKLFVVLLTLIFTITIIYPELYLSSYRDTLQFWSNEIFNKNFFSGRHLIWSNVLNAIYLCPWFGYGLHSTPGDFYNTSLSSHNLYLQLLLQMGVVGILLFVFTIYFIFLYINKSGNYNSIFAIAVLLSYMFHECFEVTLTQNNIFLGIFVWFYIGTGFNSTLSENIGKISVITE